MKQLLILAFVCAKITCGFAGRQQQRARRNSPFNYLEKNFLQNEREFIKKYHDYRNRNLAGHSTPLLVSNQVANENPSDIQYSIENILRKNNITGSVVVITNFEGVPSQAVVSKFEADPTPLHHPYYYNADQGAPGSTSAEIATQQLISSKSPYAKLVFPPTPITFRDIPTVMVIANSVMSLYNYFQAFIPNSNSTSFSNQSMLQKVQSALILYVKIRVLIKTFASQQDKIAQQVSFLGSHLLGLQTSEIDMITFNGLENQYFALKTATLKYQNDTRAAKIRDGWSSISTESINFDTNMRQIINSTVQLIQTAMLFQQTLSQLNSIVQSNARKLGLLDFLSDPKILNAATQPSLVESAKQFGLIDALANSTLVKAIENSDLFQKIKNSSVVQGLTGGRNPLDIIKSIDSFIMGLSQLVNTRQQTDNALVQLTNSLQAFRVRHNTLVDLLNQIQTTYNTLVTQDLLRKSAFRVCVLLSVLLSLFFK